MPRFLPFLDAVESLALEIARRKKAERERDKLAARLENAEATIAELSRVIRDLSAYLDRTAEALRERTPKRDG